MKYDYSSPEYREVKNQINEFINTAASYVKKAEELADETGVCFYLDIAGYGMGGIYYPPNNPEYNLIKDEYYYNEDMNEGIWRASSHSC